MEVQEPEFTIFPSSLFNLRLQACLYHRAQLLLYLKQGTEGLQVTNTLSVPREWITMFT